jgi:uncharacterized protein (UPF0210 family)
MHFLFSIISLTFLTPSSSMASQDWKLAEKNIKKLALSEFSELPQDVKRKAEEKGCSIPQSFVSAKPHNVILGSFAATGSKDWAMLCSKNGKSSIFVVWEGKQACPSEIAAEEDKIYLQTIDEQNNIGYSRVLASAAKEKILKHQKAYGGPLPKKLDHQGIDDAFAEKASTTRYCENGKWLALSGAD